MFTIVTDSSADIPLSWLLRGGVFFVPLRVIVRGKEFRSKKDTFQEDICEHALKYKGKEHLELFKSLGARTEPAPVEDFVEIYRKAPEPIISIHLSSEISHTFENAKKAAEQVDKEIYLVDSGTVSAGLGILVWHLMNCRDAGSNVKEALSKIEKLKSKVKLGVGILHPEIVEVSPRIDFDRKVENMCFAEFDGRTLKVIDEFSSIDELTEAMASYINDMGPEMTVVSHFCLPREAQELSMKIIYPSEIAEMDLAIALHVSPRALAVGAIS